MILLLVFILGLFLIFIAMQLIFRLFTYLLKTLPYFFMGKNAGFKYPWVAFVPAGRQYIAMTIPHCQYNLGLFKTDNRKMVYWIWKVLKQYLPFYTQSPLSLSIMWKYTMPEPPVIPTITRPMVLQARV